MDTFSRETGLEPWFVTGFCEGAASLTFSRSGRQISLYFAVKLGVEERSLLESLQSFFAGAGSIYELNGGRDLYFRVARVKELQHVVDHFDVYPFQGRKGVAFRIWREMFAHKLESRRRPDREHLNELAEQLSEISGAQARSRRS